MVDFTSFPIPTEEASAAGIQIVPIPQISGTNLTIPNLVTVSGNLEIGSVNILTGLSLPDTAYILGDISFGSISLQNFNLHSLVTMLGNFTANLSALTSLDLSSLVTLFGNWGVSFPELVTLNLSKMIYAGSFTGNMPLLTSLDVSSLVTVGTHFDPALATLPSLDISSIVSIGGDLDIYSEQMTSLLITSALKRIDGIVSLEGVGKHTQTSIDNLLVRVAALDGTNGTTVFANKTVDLSGGTNASPSATGLAAKATLEGRGNTVTVN